MSILKIPWMQRCGFKNDLHKLGDFLSQYVKNESKIMPPGIRRLSYTRVTYALPPNSVMNVFNRDHKLMQRERAARAEDVELYDYVKDEVGYRLSDRIFDIKRRFKKALDLGCGRGHVSKHILSDSVEELILADMCPTWLNQAQTTEGVKVEKKIVDEENMPFDPDSLDLVISCLSLHWVNDLPGCFSQIIRSLRNDGVFMAAVFGGDTLYELRSSLQLAELEREGGISPHISPFTEIRDIGSLLNRAGFTMLTVDTDEIVVGFPTMYELLWDLKGMGENNAARNRKLHLKRDTTLAAASIYEEFYGKLNEKDGSKYIPATFQIIYMLGWKPDVSQPKPLNRGTGEVSLKNLHRLDQIIKETKKVKLSDEDK
ncbi:arginine-hydroxylase NDUFAF5, mitochondrial [Neodiprion pinetum]|uniref:arginine-hydroxylase NDUFAF5, mitochondrial n=1 Tax=Neodiprion fabricii TaxID=2872261 RepID=UPI001ED94F3B|nr:arginine-hydroxylase NDUFAF5, mitochondrial [Neodiprion fabricii]XP_046477873.1 arginine-hydroxylase NDUFAF5, mitochondrial [Neodiprion pinetum]XP_046617004.1 arginine-hydroxylase NDUFAF5, mitochondrial [Neodiprion virginianus]